MNSFNLLVDRRQISILSFDKKIKKAAEKIVKSLILDSVNWEFVKNGSPAYFQKIYYPASAVFNSMGRAENDFNIFKVIKVADSLHIWGVEKFVKSRTHKEQIDLCSSNPVFFFDYHKDYGLKDLDVGRFYDFNLSVVGIN